MSLHRPLDTPTCPQRAGADACTAPAAPAAAGGADLIQLALTLNVRSDLAADLRLYIHKIQLGDLRGACQHTLAIEFICKLPQMIDNAASYVRRIRRSTQALAVKS